MRAKHKATQEEAASLKDALDKLLEKDKVAGIRIKELERKVHEAKLAVMMEVGLAASTMANHEELVREHTKAHLHANCVNKAKAKVEHKLTVTKGTLDKVYCKLEEAQAEHGQKQAKEAVKLLKEQRRKLNNRIKKEEECHSAKHSQDSEGSKPSKKKKKKKLSKEQEEPLE